MENFHEHWCSILLIRGLRDNPFDLNYVLWYASTDWLVVFVSSWTCTKLFLYYIYFFLNLLVLILNNYFPIITVMLGLTTLLGQFKTTLGTVQVLRSCMFHIGYFNCYLYIVSGCDIFLCWRDDLRDISYLELRGQVLSKNKNILLFKYFHT